MVGVFTCQAKAGEVYKVGKKAQAHRSDPGMPRKVEGDHVGEGG